MKKLISVLLCLTMVISLCACGKEKEAAKEVYDNVGKAYELLEQFSDDIHDAWRFGIQEDEVSIDSLDNELSLSKAELQEGLYAAMADYFGNTKEELLSTDSEDIDEEVSVYYRETVLPSLYFEDVYSSQFSACVNLVIKSYQENGAITEIQTLLDAAKEQLKVLSDKHSDYEHYENLKTYYTTTNTYFKFCQDPSCSFDQLQATCEDYEKEIRDCKGYLEFAFE